MADMLHHIEANCLQIGAASGLANNEDAVEFL